MTSAVAVALVFEAPTFIEPRFAIKTNPFYFVTAVS